MPLCGGGMTAGVVKVMAYRSPSGTAMHRGLQPVGAPREQVELPFVRASPPVWALLFFCQQAFSWLLFYWPAFQPAFFLPPSCALQSCVQRFFWPLSSLRASFSFWRLSSLQLSSLPYQAP